MRRSRSCLRMVLIFITFSIGDRREDSISVGCVVTTGAAFT